MLYMHMYLPHVARVSRCGVCQQLLTPHLPAKPSLVRIVRTGQVRQVAWSE